MKLKQYPGQILERYDGISVEASRVLEAGPTSGFDRSAENLPKLRQEIKTRMVPIIQRALSESGVRTQNEIIAGMECLTVHPIEKTVDWDILFCFGGGFVKGSPFEDLVIAAPLSAKTGARVILPNYRLAPEHPWPAAIDDVFSVYSALADAQFALVGESAGGNLALSVMLRARSKNVPLPTALTLLSPWCDLGNSGDSLVTNDGRDPTLRLHELEISAGHYVAGNDPNDPSISPINGLFDPAFPPSLITTGTRDLLLSQSVHLANRLLESGVSVDLQVWENLWHVFEWDNQIPEARKSISRIANFLAKQMR